MTGLSDEIRKKFLKNWTGGGWTYWTSWLICCYMILLILFDFSNFVPFYISLKFWSVEIQFQSIRSKLLHFGFILKPRTNNLLIRFWLIKTANSLEFLICTVFSMKKSIYLCRKLPYTFDKILVRLPISSYQFSHGRNNLKRILIIYPIITNRFWIQCQTIHKFSLKNE